MAKARQITITLATVLGAIAMLALPGAATAKDRNHDRIPDRWEKRHRLSLKVNQTHRDQDRDNLRNRAEFLAGTNPRNADSDGDGIPDGEENAGKIASFDSETGKLAIDLFGGSAVSGLVTEETEIECRNQKDPGASALDSEGSEGSDDEQQGEEPGDDEEGQDEQGDDQEESGDDDGPGSNCTTADLVAGAVVHEAELEIEEGSVIFEKVELAG